MEVELGVEPRSRESESHVLPLHHSTCYDVLVSLAKTIYPMVHPLFTKLRGSLYVISKLEN